MVNEQVVDLSKTTLQIENLFYFKYFSHLCGHVIRSLGGVRSSLP